MLESREKKEAVSSSNAGKLPLLISCLLGCVMAPNSDASASPGDESRVTIQRSGAAPSLDRHDRHLVDVCA